MPTFDYSNIVSNQI
jgi:hypothetical protein